MWVRLQANLSDFWNVTIWETKRLLKSPKFILSSLFLVITVYLYLILASDASSLQSVLIGEKNYENGIIRAFVFVSQFLTSLLLIVFLTDLISDDKSLEFLWGAVTDRWPILLGKIFAAIISTIFVIVLLAIELAFIFWVENSRIVSFPNQIMAVLLIIFFSGVSASFISACSLFGKKLNSSGLGAHLPIFFFYVIPYLVYTSALYGFLDENILKISYIYYISSISDYILPPVNEKLTTGAKFALHLLYLIAIGIISLISSLFIFSSLEES